jgi:polysaccharide pyruvyl transferase WcaK-like protein
MLLLVYGWYGRANSGDQLMAAALDRLFVPRGCELRFVGKLKESEVKECDGVIFGGGSILFNAPDSEPKALEALRSGARPIFYLGVGAETGIHPVHAELIDRAHVVAVRSPESLDAVPSARLAPDLVYSLPRLRRPKDPDRGLLVVPNIEVVPQHTAPYWAHIGWERFKDELAQALDQLIEERQLRPSFLLMCRNSTMDDAWPAQEIIARMTRRSTEFELIRAPLNDLRSLAHVMARHRVVLTQRYHGIIAAQLAGVPHVSVHHHDKLKQAWPDIGGKVPFHGVTKKQLVQSVEYAASLNREQLTVDAGVYDVIADDVVAAVAAERSKRVAT